MSTEATKQGLGKREREKQSLKIQTQEQPCFPLPNTHIKHGQELLELPEAKSENPWFAFGQETARL